jgi:hypothetical protein
MQMAPKAWPTADAVTTGTPCHVVLTDKHDTVLVETASLAIAQQP